MSIYAKQLLDEASELEIGWEADIRYTDGIRRITNDNLEYLCGLLSTENNPDSYLTSPTYYAFTGRKGLWVYREDGSFVIFCWHPNVPGQILVFLPRNDTGTQKALTNLLQSMPEPPSGLRLARIQQANSKNLPSMEGTFQRSVVLAPVIEHVLDWKYPVHVLSTDKIVRMEGHAFKRIRNHVYHLMDSDDVIPEPLTGAHLPALKSFINEWVEKHTHDLRSFDEFISPYDKMLNLLENEILGMKGLLFTQGKKVKAFTLWDVSNNITRTANRYVNLCDTSRRGMAEFVMHHVAKYLADTGIQYLNVGGSETADLDQFKSKFMPAYSLDLCSVDVIIEDSYRTDNIANFPLLKRTGT